LQTGRCVDCLTYLHFSRKSSVKIDGVHSKVRDQIFPQQINGKVPTLDISRDLLKRLAFCRNRLCIQSIHGTTGSQENPRNISAHVTDFIEKFLKSKYNLIFGLDTDGCSCTIRSKVWFPLSSKEWALRNGYPVPERVIPYFVSQNTDVDSELARRISEKEYETILGIDPSVAVLS
jgi:hypothetical protein